MTPQTPFIVGSLTKSFTALAVMQLAEAGKLELDVPVQRYIPWFRLAILEASAQITIRHLLNHTSGISRYIGRELLAGKGDKTIEQRVRELRTVTLTEPVGATFQWWFGVPFPADLPYLPDALPAGFLLSSAEDMEGGQKDQRERSNYR